MIWIAALAMAALSAQSETAAAPVNGPHRFALLIAPRAGSTGIAIQTQWREQLLRSAPLGYTEASVATPIDLESKRDPLAAIHAALAASVVPGSRADACLVAVAAECVWRNGDLTLQLAKTPGSALSVPLVAVVEALDRAPARTKLGILLLRADADVAVEQFAKLGKLCRLWNARRWQTDWVVALAPAGGRNVPGEATPEDELRTILAGAGDVDRDGDGVIDEREMAAAWFSRAARMNLRCFLWQTNRFGTTQDSAGLASTAIAINERTFGEVRRRIERLEGLKNQGAIAADALAEGTRLLTRMPAAAADRRLRAAYEQLLENRLDGAGLASVRAATVADRRLDAAAAKRFADALVEAHVLARDRFVQPSRVNAATAEALRYLLWICGETPALRTERKLRELESDPDAALADLPLAIRMQIGKREDLSGRRDIDECLKRMADSLDNYSDYFPPTLYAEEKKLNEGHFTGLGLQVQSAVRGGLEIVAVLPRGSAHRAGLAVGDRIVRFNDRQLLGMDYDAAANLLVGRRGQKATLMVERPGIVGNLQFSVEFDRIQMETVLGLRRGRDDQWQSWLDGQRGLAYLRIASFSDDTVKQLRAALSELRRRELTGVILDLRENAGGVLPAAIEVAAALIGGETVVNIVDATGAKQPRSGAAFGAFRDFPLAVIIDRNSASGAELVAAALQDHRRAVVVGERSFGKGSVQSLFEIERQTAAFKVTTELFERPNGRSLNRFAHSRETDSWGVVPDAKYRVRFTDREMERLAAKFAADATVGFQSRALTLDVDADRGIALAIQALAAQQ